MNNSNPSFYNHIFSHIYIENEIKNNPVTQKILSHFPKSERIEIDHYKDIFCRSHQNYRLQKQTPGLILARKHQNMVYEGAPVCQNFGNQHFYYTSSVMNCIYDCEYCYLQGMYPSANLVVFVNLEEIFEQVELLLQKHQVYLCVSYDTDLLALEQLLGYSNEWIKFASDHSNLSIELRTKSANSNIIKKLEPRDNVILAWTLSPEKLAEKLEHHVPTFNQRLKCIKQAIACGFRVRLCFDPLLYCADWREHYRDMIDIVFSEIQPDQIEDVSIGVFRVSQDYLKKMRKQAQNCAVLQYPFENDNGIYHYSREFTNEMISFVYELVHKKISEEKIFCWEPHSPIN